MTPTTYVARFTIIEALRWPLRRNATLARVLVNLAREAVGAPDRVQHAKVTIDGRHFVVTLVGRDREETHQAERN